MKRHSLIAGLAILLLAGVAGGQTIRKSGRTTIVEVEKRFQIGDNGSLSLSGSSADVTVTGWGGEEVVIHEVIRLKRASRRKAEEVAHKAESDYVQHENEVVIATEHLPRRNASARFEIRVPRRFDVSINVNGGDISVADLAGSQHLRTSGGDVRLRKIDGLVDVVTAGGDIRAEDLGNEARLKTSGGDVHVERAGAALTVKTSGGDVVLRKLKGRTTALTSGGDIRVVGSSDDLRLKTTGGDIEVVDAAGRVEAFTSGGDIEVIRCEGELIARTSGGDIQLRRVGQARVSTSGGDVAAEQVTGGIRASTSGGDLRLQEIDGFIEAKTSGGDIVAELIPKDYSSDHHVRMATSGGDIRLSIPKDLPASIRAVIETRSSPIDEFELRSDFPLEITRRDGRRRGEIRGEGDINGGGDSVDLRAVEGNITIRSLP